jgi:Xaa-Pro aminopeptidase
MKTDIDSLMQSHNLDALLLVGPGQHNPFMVYLTGGAHLGEAILIKPRGQPPLLFHYDMERDEAARTGLETRVINDGRFDDLRKQADDNDTRMLMLVLQQALNDLGLTRGRLGVCGLADAGQAFAALSALQDALPGLEIAGAAGPALLLQAMSTKEDSEIARIRRMGHITTQVVGEVADFLSSQHIADETLVKADGSPLTIGEVKRRIDLWLAERGAENPEGVIFAMGRDAGVPHTTGDNAAPLRLGQTIVFDIFPREAGGGYFYDFTRTWCLGYASDEALALYEDVLTVYHQVISELRLGAPCRDYQRRACELFEARGHPSVLSQPEIRQGYVHGLGHGLGLHVHEDPSFSAYSPENMRLLPGVVITVEPGLYYPERGLGVRLEDTCWARPDGQFEVLAPYPLDLILPLRQG